MPKKKKTWQEILAEPHKPNLVERYRGLKSAHDAKVKTVYNYMKETDFGVFSNEVKLSSKEYYDIRLNLYLFNDSTNTYIDYPVHLERLIHFEDDGTMEISDIWKCTDVHGPFKNSFKKDSTYTSQEVLDIIWFIFYNFSTAKISRKGDIVLYFTLEKFSPYYTGLKVDEEGCTDIRTIENFKIYYGTEHDKYFMQ